MCLHSLMAVLHTPIFVKPSAHSSLKISASVEKQHCTVNANQITSLPRPLSMADLTPQATHGSQLRVAYQGLPGAYCEAAACRAYPNCEAVPCEQFEAAFEAVELWAVDRAVLPIENTLDGSVHRNYDLLLRHKLHIVGEVQFSLHHYLLGLSTTRNEQLQGVLSRPQFLDQRENASSKPRVITDGVEDASGTAQFNASHMSRDAEVVPSAKAAEKYGLEIRADGIQDDKENVTRFLMLAREPIIPNINRPFKTSIIFTLDEGPGVLFKVLGIFTMRKINLTKIESRPLPKRHWRAVDDEGNKRFIKHFRYLFFLDFEASMAERRAKNALHHLQEFASFLRVLGSYPTDDVRSKLFQTF